MKNIFKRKNKTDEIIEEYEAKIEKIMADYEAKIAEIIEDYEGEVDCITKNVEARRRNDETVYEALVNVLENKKATKGDMTAAMRKAVGYLGENLEG